MQKDETTFNLDDMERKDLWSYYTSSYVRIEPTEGVPRGRMQRSVLPRNLPSNEAESEDSAGPRKPLAYSEDLILRVCVNTSKILFKSGSSEWFIYGDKPLTWDADKDVATSRLRLKKFEDTRTEKFREKFVLNNKWMKDLDHEEVQKITSTCKKWIEDGILPGRTPPADVVMEGVAA
jgi:paired amphipathic helix protein Sin3a